MNPKKIECHRGTIHLYGPWTWHDDAKIIGTREALQSLKDALEHVLRDQGPAYIETFTSDGEGFDLLVKMASEQEIDALPMPYTDRETNPLTERVTAPDA